MTEIQNMAEFEQEILSRKGYSAVDFWAPWCGPCRMMAPVLESAAEAMGDVHFTKCNVDENQELAMKFGIMSIPTVVLFKDGKEIHRMMGAVPLQAFMDELKGHM